MTTDQTSSQKNTALSFVPPYREQAGRSRYGGGGDGGDSGCGSGCVGGDDDICGGIGGCGSGGDNVGGCRDHDGVDVVLVVVMVVRVIMMMLLMMNM